MHRFLCFRDGAGRREAPAERKPLHRHQPHPVPQQHAAHPQEGQRGTEDPAWQLRCRFGHFKGLTCHSCSNLNSEMMQRWTSGVAHLYTNALDGQQLIWLLDSTNRSSLYLSDVTSRSHRAHATFVSAATEQWGLKGGPVRPKHVSHVRRRSVDEYLLFLPC